METNSFKGAFDVSKYKYMYYLMSNYKLNLWQCFIFSITNSHLQITQNHMSV